MLACRLKIGARPAALLKAVSAPLRRSGAQFGFTARPGAHPAAGWRCLQATRGGPGGGGGVAPGLARREGRGRSPLFGFKRCSGRGGLGLWRSATRRSVAFRSRPRHGGACAAREDGVHEALQGAQVGVVRRLLPGAAALPPQPPPPGAGASALAVGRLGAGQRRRQRQQHRRVPFAAGSGQPSARAGGGSGGGGQRRRGGTGRPR